MVVDVERYIRFVAGVFCDAIEGGSDGDQGQFNTCLHTTLLGAGKATMVRNHLST